MKLILQRVTQAAVTVQGERREIGPGLVILLGIAPGDTEKTSAYLAEKAVNLRIFDDGEGLMNRSLLDCGGGCLVVSNFTLYASCRKGRRPSFVGAGAPEMSEPLYRHFVAAVKAAGVSQVETGEFGAEMQIALTNDGPVTIILDSDEIMPQG